MSIIQIQGGLRSNHFTSILFNNGSSDWRENESFIQNQHLILITAS